MSWSYGASPLTSPSDTFRLLVGDTDPTNPLLQDAEVSYYLTLGNTFFAAAAAAEAIAAKLSALPDRAMGKLKISSSQMATAFRATAVSLRALGARQGVSPVLFAESVAAKIAQEQDGDRLVPAFSADLQEYPGMSPTDLESTVGDDDEF